MAMFAGCVGAKGDPTSTGPSGPPVATGPAEFSDANGAIEGLVIDDETLPIQGVIVAAYIDPAQSSQVSTDAAGRFVINNLAPGAYNVAAAKLGYDSIVKRIEVVQGEVASASFSLRQIEIHEGYHESFVQDGYFECSWTGVYGTGPCFFPIISDSNSQVNYPLWPNNKRQFDYPVGPGAVTVFNELTWDRTTAATGDTMAIFLSYAERTTSHRYCSLSETKPVNLRWDRAMLKDGQFDEDDDEAGECMNGSDQLPNSEPQTIPMEGQMLTTRVNTGPGNVPGSSEDTAGIGIAFQQSFELYVTYFFWEYAPADFSALSDA